MPLPLFAAIISVGPTTTFSLRQRGIHSTTIKNDNPRTKPLLGPYGEPSAIRRLMTQPATIYETRNEIVTFQ